MNNSYFMGFDSEKVLAVERELGDLVTGIKGLRKIKGCSNLELQTYRISFGYQRRKPFKIYLLIYDPEIESIRLVADGGIGRPPENIRQRLFEELGTENYSDDGPNAFKWDNIKLNLE